MKRTTYCTRTAVGIALAAALVPGTAFAATGPLGAGALDTGAFEAEAVAAPTPQVTSIAASVAAAQSSAHRAVASGTGTSLIAQCNNLISKQSAKLDAAVQAAEEAEFDVVTTPVSTTDRLLTYDRAAIDAIGTQQRTGHTICCPSFSCAYADAVLDGTIHDHSYYSCSCCRWTDWGGGNSSFRRVGTDEQLLREAYDQITAGRPTVIHVRASYGEHWIALIGYEDAVDPDHLTLANFIGLDPWDGAQINAASRFTLYGDGCEHISDR